MNPLSDVSRRSFLQGVVSTGALVLSVRFGAESLWAVEAVAGSSADQSVLHPSVYLGVDTDGTVYIIAHRSEMGTTSRTSLPLVVAEELDADWSRVKVQQAIGDPRYGSQDTDGSHLDSRILRTYAAGRRNRAPMLIRAAAQKWGVPESECADRPARGGSQGQRQEGRLRRAGRGGRQAACAKRRT